MEYRYIGIFPIIGKVIDIDMRHLEIIGDLEELISKSLSKLPGKLSKNYQYQKKMTYG